MFDRLLQDLRDDETREMSFVTFYSVWQQMLEGEKEKVNIALDESTPKFITMYEVQK